MNARPPADPHVPLGGPVPRAGRSGGAAEEGGQPAVQDRQPGAVGAGPRARIEIAPGQTPFRVLVSDSDSRVSPEILFGRDRGRGELFIVRNAGNTVDATASGSIEHAVAGLGVPLVLGHSRCGAVEAAVDVRTNNTVHPGAIAQMTEPIVPAVPGARTELGDLVGNAVRANVSRVVRCLRTASEPGLLTPRAGRTPRIVGAAYRLDTSGVCFFDEA